MIMPPGQLCQFRKPGQDGIIVFSPVRKCTGRTVFNPFLRIGETSAAGLAQGIEWAVTKKAVKHFLRHTGVAGKHLAFSVLEKHVVASFPVIPLLHNQSPLLKNKRPRQPARTTVAAIPTAKQRNSTSPVKFPKIGLLTCDKKKLSSATYCPPSQIAPMANSRSAPIRRLGQVSRLQCRHVSVSHRISSFGYLTLHEIPDHFWYIMHYDAYSHYL